MRKGSVSFSGLIQQKTERKSAGPELYLDNCTESDFENEGQLAEAKCGNTQKPLKTEYWVLKETLIPLQFDFSESKEEEKETDWSQDQATKKSSYKEHRVDALAPYAEEGRGKLRKAAGNCKQVTIRRYPNGGTRPEQCLVIMY